MNTGLFLPFFHHKKKSGVFWVNSKTNERIGTGFRGSMAYKESILQKRLQSGAQHDTIKEK